MEDKEREVKQEIQVVQQIPNASIEIPDIISISSSDMTTAELVEVLESMIKNKHIKELIDIAQENKAKRRRGYMN